MSKLNIAMVAYTNYTTDPRVMREAETANSAGFNVDFFCLRKSEEKDCEDVRGVNVIRLKHSRYRGSSHKQYLFSYIIFFFKCFIKISLQHFRKKYKIIHVNNMPDFLVFCTIVPKLFGAKIILDIHDPMGITFSNKFKTGTKSVMQRILLWQERASAWYSNHVITVSEILKREVLIANGLDPQKITVVENFPKDEQFNLIEDYVVGEKIKLVYHGTIAERYGIQNVLKTLSLLSCKDQFFFQIIGDGDFSADIKKIIEELNLTGIVNFDNHHYPVNELRKKLSGFNIGIVSFTASPALEYMSFTKLMEYIALGFPVVTLSNAVIKYHLREQDCFFYDPRDLSTLGKRLTEIANNKEMLYVARERIISIRNKFLWSNEGKKYVTVLNSLLIKK